MADDRRDPGHLLDLLWRTHAPGSRGPRGSLSLDRVVATAVEIADAEGVAAVSMRRVAERLGVTTMSLYRYVPGKDDLVDLMFEMATGLPDDAAWPEDWRGGLAAFARASRALLLARPWMLDVPISAPPMGPNNLAWMEAALSRLARTGLDEGEMVGVLSILSGYTFFEAGQQLAMSRAAPRTGVGYSEWGQAYAAMLERVAGDGRYPTLARVARAGGFGDERSGPEEDFEYGLSFILDGVEALIGARAHRAARGGAGVPEGPGVN
ncbi:TetR/AcrR family transcriptional regulator [Streptomyces sp. DSM 44917]|uniref:TetR/AcrR family transcriptional regulator n=1 Tax=Streptomyces boetiae TaxID=3075541 RepID=A0ABU2LCS4_9ACTN|nr:TetR/AcrR family transcriptional regulator [Streptomyces sp. DSM 44917]MDT0309381.1 TetR/AcrR family transcriptional regulator [Streptomyces sp. DSM 44917]